jgi:hypothetical protein
LGTFSGFGAESEAGGRQLKPKSQNNGWASEIFLKSNAKKGTFLAIFCKIGKKSVVLEG